MRLEGDGMMAMDNESLPNDTFNGTNIDGMDSWNYYLIIVLKSFVLILIICTAIFGNVLIILSVYRYHRLRITTNYFIVSLACADILVALFAMSFNALYTLSGRWMFNQFICDFWNSCDVLFSTASIMHLCCISVDRYYAIVKPFQYPNTITTRTVGGMLASVWLVSGLLSFIPIFSGWYTTNERLQARSKNPEVCEFVVNKPYAIVSSCISFWIPCLIMVSAYIRIYFEAAKQERMILKSHISAAIPQYPRNSTDTTAQMVVHSTNHHRNSHVEDDHNTPTKRNIVKMKREHKAAKTLGIIMGAFIVCWLPFFIWYVTVHLCETCICPDLVVEILFWIGYFNSSLNPIIYAYFNTDFREAMKDTIVNHLCCCLSSCRCKKHYNQNNNIHFNCTYRSTQDIGLVENKYNRGNI